MGWSKQQKFMVATGAVVPFLVTITLAYSLLKGPSVSSPGHSKGVGTIKIAVERVLTNDATPQFTFPTVPPPMVPNAATGAKFTLAAGQRDVNGILPMQLQSGMLPGGPDAPHQSFFFTDGANGGRIVIDLNTAIDIKQVNTYSWHVGARAPQVYTLYASDGALDGFNPSPAGTSDPTGQGWKLVAKVDTRPKSKEMGGQYGVSVSSSAGSIGHYRYLLFDCKRTEEDDRWGNTFYSAFNVIAK